MSPPDPNIALSLLSRSHSPDTASRLFTEKIKTRPLHLKPSTEHELQTAQQQRRHTRLTKLSQRKKALKPAPLSARQKRALGLYTIPPSAQKYEIYKGLHRLWTGYIWEVLGLKEGGEDKDGNGNAEAVMDLGAAAKMCSADFHGAEVLVVRSRCVGRVGIRGIVVKDSRGVFEVVTRGNVVKRVPKEHTIFRVVVERPGKGVEEGAKEEGNQHGGDEDDVKKGIATEKEGNRGKDIVFEIHGDQFMHRAADRATKKWKTHFFPDL